MYRQGTAASLLRSVGWKLGALIVPELFLWAAFVQLLNARGLCQQAQSYLSIKLPPVGADERDVESVVSRVFLFLAWTRLRFLTGY